MSEASTVSSTGIRRLEKKKGRLWGFLRKRPPGEVEPLPASMIAGRLRHLMMTVTRTMGSYVRGKMGEGTLRDMLEYQADEFASNVIRAGRGADQIARLLIKLNFQPLGMKAEYTGDSEAARIVVIKCPLPERFLQRPELLVTFFEPEGDWLEGLRGLGDSLTARGEWPPKPIEACSLCKVVVPRVGEKIGFTWEHGMTVDKPPQCYFKIKLSNK